MHNAWLLENSHLTIELPSDYFHSFLFTTFYLMIRDSFMLQMLKRFGSVSFHLNNTILPALDFNFRDSFMLQMLKGSDSVSFHLNKTILPALDFNFPHSQTWFESPFNFTIMTLFVLSKIFCTTRSDAAF